MRGASQRGVSPFWCTPWALHCVLDFLQLTMLHHRHHHHPCHHHHSNHSQEEPSPPPLPPATPPSEGACPVGPGATNAVLGGSHGWCVGWQLLVDGCEAPLPLVKLPCAALGGGLYPCGHPSKPLTVRGGKHTHQVMRDTGPANHTHMQLGLQR